MSDNSNTRLDKFEKRRKNTKLINYLFSIGSVLIILLIGIWIFGGSDEEAADNLDENATNSENEDLFVEVEDEDEKNSESNEEESEESNEEEVANETEIEEKEEEDQANQEIEIKETEPSDPSDENVIEAYTGDWPPVGTSQTGPHSTDYADGSQDRIEIKEAASLATGIPTDEIIERWVGNGGDQKVVATVSDSELSETYRVYLSWIDNEGWQPTKVETLKEYKGKND